MRRWVVTGPAGGGKSLLCGYLARAGAAVLDGDRLGHEILARPEIRRALEEEFGPGVLTTGGLVDRAFLGNRVFADPEALDRLNAITHGPLSHLAAAGFAALERDGTHRLAVLEAAVYFLLPPVPGVELVITVTASAAIRLRRLMELTGLERGAAQARVDAQRPLEKDWAAADVVLVNEGSPAQLEREAAALLARLED